MAIMAMSRIQFQPGLSMPEFLKDYGTEAQCGIRPSIRARNSALRVERPSLSNPRAAASAICFIVPSLVIDTLRLAS
jgi:hypothetical protein